MNKNVAYVGLVAGVISVVYLLSIEEVSLFGVACRVIGTQKVSGAFGPISEPVCLSNGVYFTGMAIGILLVLFAAAFILKDILFPTAVVTGASSRLQSRTSFQSAEARPAIDPVVRNPAPAVVSSRDNPAWKTLKEFDADIQGAIAQLSDFGPQAEERLASAYLSVSDKGLLPSIVSKIAAEEEQGAIAREEEKARCAVAMSERERELLAERERRAQYTIHLIKEAGMVYDGRKVISAEMYYGAAAADQGWAKILYEDGRTELRAGSSWMLMKA